MQKVNFVYCFRYVYLYTRKTDLFSQDRAVSCFVSSFAIGLKMDDSTKDEADLLWNFIP